MPVLPHISFTPGVCSRSANAHLSQAAELNARFLALFFSSYVESAIYSPFSCASNVSQMRQLKLSHRELLCALNYTLWASIETGIVNGGSRRLGGPILKGILEYVK